MTIKECPLCLTFYPRYSTACSNANCILEHGGKRALLLETKKQKKKYTNNKEAVFFVFLGAVNPLVVTRRDICRTVQYRFENQGLGSKELFQCLAKLIIFEWVETLDGVTFSLTPYGYQVGIGLVTGKIKFNDVGGVKTANEKKKLIFDLNNVRMGLSDEQIYNLVGVEAPSNGLDCDQILDLKNSVAIMEEIEDMSGEAGGE